MCTKASIKCPHKHLSVDIYHEDMYYIHIQRVAVTFIVLLALYVHL